MEDNIQFSAIIIAAGYSSRMKDFKPLLKFGEYTAIEFLVNTYLQCEIKDIIVVVGYKADEIIKNLSHLKVKWIINQNYDKGMYSSIKSGVREINENSTGFFLNPVDIPIVKINTIESLKIEYLKKEKDIIYPLFNGKKGHPPLISTKYDKYILKDESAQGLRNLLDFYKENARGVSVIDWGIVNDMDTKQDYNKLKEYYDLRYVPNEEECAAIWSKYKVPLEIIEHCKAVAFIAYEIGTIVMKKGYSIDLNKIKSAALLHDIGRMEKKHEEVGAQILRSFGYNEIADIVRVHMNISFDIKLNSKLTEDEIVFLADKLVLGKNRVSLKERFNRSTKKYKNNPEIIKNINLKYENCKTIINKITKITGEDFLYEEKKHLSH